jgi:hypothetical protein
LGGGFKTEVKAIQIGGPLGGLVPVSKIDKLTIDFESFSNEGFCPKKRHGKQKIRQKIGFINTFTNLTSNLQNML